MSKACKPSCTPELQIAQSPAPAPPTPLPSAAADASTTVFPPLSCSATVASPPQLAEPHRQQQPMLLTTALTFRLVLHCCGGSSHSPSAGSTPTASSSPCSTSTSGLSPASLRKRCTSRHTTPSSPAPAPSAAATTAAEPKPKGYCVLRPYTQRPYAGREWGAHTHEGS